MLEREGAYGERIADGLGDVNAVEAQLLDAPHPVGHIGSCVLAGREVIRPRRGLPTDSGRSAAERDGVAVAQLPTAAGLNRTVDEDQPIGDHALGV